LRSAIRETGHGVITLDAAGLMNHVTPGTQALLAHYFPAARKGRALPAPLVAWLQEGSTVPFISEVGTGRLIIRSPQRSGRRLLLLSEGKQCILPNGASLTSRETEVLNWMAQGKTNPEIAVILGVAAGTVKLHVQHVLAKLGAENRMAATVVAREAGLLFPPGRKGASSA